VQPLKNNRFNIPKSRYDSVDLYISEVWYNRPEYNDTDVPYDEAVFERLRHHGEPQERSGGPITDVRPDTPRDRRLALKAYRSLIHSGPHSNLFREY
jgi:hypothetical protein